MSEDKNIRILIAEDEVPISKALKLKLEKTGFEVQIAKNGEEALSLLEKGKYDLMLLDLIMPIVDGFSVLQEIRKKENPIPIIVLSNLSQEEDLKKAEELGAMDYFIKSDTPIAEVVNIINNALQK